jgi:hypothetical protein
MNVGDWVTPSARGKEHCWHTEERGPGSFRRRGFYDDMIGVIIERNYNTRSSMCEYTIMWTNADITKHWTRGQLKYARVKR